MSGWFVNKFKSPGDEDDDPEWDNSFPAMGDHELDCPDTQPTSPGALDSLPKDTQ